MGAELAQLGVYPKPSAKDKVYYVNRLNYAASIPSVDEDGKRIQKYNSATGEPIRNSRGEFEYHDDSIEFVKWQPRFTELGYWSVYVVSAEKAKTDKKLQNIGKYLEDRASRNDNEIIAEKEFIKRTNPMLLAQMAEKDELTKEVEALRMQKSQAEEEIARLKGKAGIK
jgi:hypothetical protein